MLMNLGPGRSKEGKQNSICDNFNTEVNRFVICIVYNAFTHNIFRNFLTAANAGFDDWLFLVFLFERIWRHSQ